MALWQFIVLLVFIYILHRAELERIVEIDRKVCEIGNDLEELSKKVRKPYSVLDD